MLNAYRLFFEFFTLQNLVQLCPYAKRHFSYTLTSLTCLSSNVDDLKHI